jgi:hypothetical protein
MSALSVVIAAGAGCATLPPPKVSPEMAGLVIYVDDKIETTLQDSDCRQAPAQKWAQMKADGFRSALLRAGFAVVLDPKQQRDMVAKLQLVAYSCSSSTGSPNSGVPVDWDVSFQNRGRLVEQRSWNAFDGPGDSEGGVRGFATSEALRKFASGPHEPDYAGSGGGAAVASTGTAPKPTSSSPSSAPTNFVQGGAQNNAFAFIVGVTNYRDVPRADGAKQDAERFAALARTTLGIPEDHIRVAYDDRATRSDLEKHLAWLKQNVPAGGRIYFAFSGHGAPNPSSGTPYLLPFDGDPKDLDRTAISLSAIVDALADTRAADVLVLLDSCFSGAGGRSVLAAGGRPLVAVKSVEAKARVAVFSAATDAEISGAAPNGAGGLFSHVLAQAIGHGDADVNGDGDISLDELATWVTPRVTRQARKDSREQTPRLILGSDLQAAKFVVARGLATH